MRFIILHGKNETLSQILSFHKCSVIICMPSYNMNELLASVIENNFSFPHLLPADSNSFLPASGHLST